MSDVHRARDRGEQVRHRGSVLHNQDRQAVRERANHPPCESIALGVPDGHPNVSRSDIPQVLGKSRPRKQLALFVTTEPTRPMVSAMVDSARIVNLAEIRRVTNRWMKLVQ